MRVICIVGLPGSGKTTLAAHMTANEGLLLDDIKDIEILSSCLKAYDGPFIVITDPAFCSSNTRKWAIEYFDSKGVNPEWIFFENDPAKCYTNVAIRNDGRKVTNHIRDLSKLYQIPDNVDIRSIWQPYDSP